MTTTIKINGAATNPMNLSIAMRHLVIAEIEAKYAPDHPANVYADSRSFKSVNEWIANFCHAWEGQGLGVFSVEITDSTKAAIVARVEKILADGGLSLAFHVAIHPSYPNLVEAKHNAQRGSSTHEREDMHNAAKALRANGFDADISGLMLLVRETPKRAVRFIYEGLDGERVYTNG